MAATLTADQKREKFNTIMREIAELIVGMDVNVQAEVYNGHVNALQSLNAQAWQCWNTIKPWIGPPPANP